jgi:hypothetical protein
MREQRVGLAVFWAGTLFLPVGIVSGSRSGEGRKMRIRQHWRRRGMNRIFRSVGYSGDMLNESFQRAGAVLAACVFLVALTGCTSQHGPRTALTLTEIRSLERDRFAAGRHLLGNSSISERRLGGEAWLPGDTVLLGIAVDAGNEQREWYLRARALGKIFTNMDGISLAMSDTVRVRRAAGGEWVRLDYDLVRVLVELFDGEGELLSSSESLMPELCLQHGLFEYVSQSLDGLDAFAPGQMAYGDHGEILASDELKRAVAGWIAIMKLPEFLQRDPGMDTLIWRLIDRPSLLSLVAHRGLKMEVGLNGKDARPEPARSEYGDAYRVPVMLTLNGRPAVRCEIVIARGDPPLGPCNGLLAIDAAHPSDPSRRIAVRLLAAQRGDPDAARCPR